MPHHKPFPLLTCKPKNRPIKEINFYDEDILKRAMPKPVCIKFNNKTILYKKAIDFLKKGAIILWIENTVKEAFETFNVLSKSAPEKCDILHSRYTSEDRMVTEKKCIERFKKRNKSGYILISTQICEQSLDIDSDILFSSLAPSDMMIQRLGRLWRHRYNDKIRPIESPRLYWFAPNLIKEANQIKTEKEMFKIKKQWLSCYVYEPYILFNTFKLWSNFEKIKLPQDTRFIIEKTYEKNSEYPFLFKLMQEKIQNMKNLVNISTNTFSAFNEEGPINDNIILGTRLNGATKKVCLLNEDGNTTIHNKPVLNKTHKINACKSLIPLLKTTLDNLKDIIEERLYFQAIRMKKIDNIWIPFNYKTGKLIKNFSYDNKKGWYEHE